ncbi:hypothetical protein [Plantibacter sp. YIM 135249]|uniref:hypothetical protein n=1 Tax=Plantibacter sp. YIM 135249 TaxID=3423918 RepID=UPI003D334F2C
MPEQPEPTGWELLRGINSLKDSINSMAAGMVSQSTLALYQSAQADRDKRQDERLKQLETDQAEQRKTKAQQWFAIGMALFGIVCTIIAGVIVFNVTRIGG